MNFFCRIFHAITERKLKCKEINDFLAFFDNRDLWIPELAEKVVGFEMVLFSQHRAGVTIKMSNGSCWTFLNPKAAIQFLKTGKVGI